MTTITTKTEGCLVSFWRLESLQFNNLLANGFKHPQTIFFGGHQQPLKLRRKHSLVWNTSTPLIKYDAPTTRQLSSLKVAATTCNIHNHQELPQLPYISPLTIATITNNVSQPQATILCHQKGWCKKRFVESNAYTLQ